MECEHCGLEKRVADLEKDSERNQHTHKEFYGKFEELGRGQAVADERYSAIQATLVSIQADLKELKEKPGKRWESVVQTVLQWVVVAILAAVVVFK